MYKGTIEFDLQDFLSLLTHYSNGEVPKGLEVINFGPSSKLRGWYAIVVKMDKPWPGAVEIGDNTYEPFHFRFEGDKILTMNEKNKDPVITNFDPARPI